MNNNSSKNLRRSKNNRSAGHLLEEIRPTHCDKLGPARNNTGSRTTSSIQNCHQLLEGGNTVQWLVVRWSGGESRNRRIDKQQPWRRRPIFQSRRPVLGGGSWLWLADSSINDFSDWSHRRRHHWLDFFCLASAVAAGLWKNRITHLLVGRLWSDVACLSSDALDCGPPRHRRRILPLHLTISAASDQQQHHHWMDGWMDQCGGWAQGPSCVVHDAGGGPSGGMWRLALHSFIYY